MDPVPTASPIGDHQRMLTLAFDALSNGVVITDPGFRVTWANRQARSVLGLDARTGEGGGAKIAAMLDKVREGGDHGNPFLLVLFKPERLFLWVHCRPVRDATGTTLGHVIELRDHTDSQDSNRRSLEIASFIVHRFPELSEQFAELLPSLRGSEVHREIQSVHREIRRQVDKLVAFTELEAGPLRIQRLPLEPDDLVGTVVGQLRPLADERQLRLELDLGFGDGLIDADDEWLTRLVHILVENALTYATPASAVAVRTSATTEGRLQVEVRNEVADPLERETVERWFDLRRQLADFEATTSEDFSLELPLAHHIVEAHGGRIWVELPDERRIAVRFEI